MQVTVIGAGVSGLTSAAALLERGHEVRIVARERHPDTVSVVAAAIWTMTATEPQERTRAWALTSWARFRELAELPTTGVVPLRQLELERIDPGPSWWESTPHVRRVAAADLPPGYAAGFDIDGFMVEPPLYLDWLACHVDAAGGSVDIATVAALDEVEGDLVVNCSGLGATSLAADSSMFLIRGQVVAVDNPDIRDAIADESVKERIAYVYPRSTELVLGGARDDHRTDPEPDPAIRERILADCARLDPRVAGLAVKAERVGLRPGRPTVRLDIDELPDGRPVIHNYGHSGAGFILSWGCAGEVADLTEQLSAGSRPR